MAMALMGRNSHYLAHTIQRQHFNSTAKAVGYGANTEPLLTDFLTRTPAIVEKVRNDLPEGFSEKVADQLLGGPLNAAKAPKSMPAA